ncbi:prolyl oligopeptidase family serine peptidase [Roseibacillus persicicus]|uniref:S9 family peptidase n=1 Tax=Roseibacillus persicicus TaxID=454148 RepID=UPI00398A5453
MRNLVLLSLAMSSFAFADHGGTSSFEKKNQNYRRSIGTASQERLQARWFQDGEEWLCVTGEGDDALAVSAKDGERREMPTGELRESRNLRGGRNGRGGRGERRRQQPGKAPAISFPSPRQIAALEWQAEAKEDWIWGERVEWTASREYFFVMEIRDVKERQVHYTRSSPKDQLQPKYFVNNYPKPGDELRTQVPVIFSVEGKRVDVDPGLIKDAYSISRVEWQDDERIWFEFIERGFDKYRLLELNAATGKTRVVAAEEDEKFIHIFEKCGWWKLGEGKLLWRSEADGWSHLYSINEQSGERKQLTSGQWVVRGVESVRGGKVLFRLSGFYPEQDPYYNHYARLDVASGEMTMLTHGDGTHELQFSPDGSYYVDRYSRVDMPPVHELRRASDGSLITVLAEGSAEEMLSKGFLLPERFVTTDREGRYPIYGVIWKPRDFDPGRKYAVVENIYAGPHGSFVPKKWSSWYGHRSEMMGAGFVVVQIDGRGTNFRGKEFQQFAYKNLKDSGFPDRIKWMREAAKERPWMDLSRVGIYGGSAGGQSTVAGLLWHGDFYSAGVADCGCHDNRMDKIWWNEQWMGWPIDESYAANSNTEHVERLKGHLFLTVGEVDTNVDPSSTMQVVDALIRADKDFEFLSVPNGGHGIGESPYLRRKRVEFFERHLGGPIPMPQ